MYLVSLNVRHISSCCSDTRTKKYTPRVGDAFLFVFESNNRQN